MYTLPAVGYSIIQLLAVQGTVSLELIYYIPCPPACLPDAHQLVAYYNVESYPVSLEFGAHTYR